MNALKIRLQMFYYRHKKVTDFKPHVKKSKRSFWGNVILGLFLIALACLFFFPVLYMISQSLKPMNEMFIFPPKIWVKNPTLDNYRDFFNVLAKYSSSVCKIHVQYRSGGCNWIDWSYRVGFSLCLSACKV